MVGMFRTPCPGDSISVALRKLLQGGMRGSLAIYKFATKGAGHLNIRTQVSELRNLAFCVWRDWRRQWHPHSSTLAWKIPWTEEPGRLQSMASLSLTRLSDFTLTFHFHALEKAMATHSSTLAWKIPWTEEPGRLQSMGSLRVGYN